MTSDEHEQLLKYQVEGLATVAQCIDDAASAQAARHKELMEKLSEIADSLAAIRRNTSN